MCLSLTLSLSVYLSLSVCLSVCLSVSLPLPLSLSLCLSLSLSPPSLCPPSLSVCLSVSFCLCLSLSVCVSLSLSPPLFLSVCLSVCLSLFILVQIQSLPFKDTGYTNDQTEAKKVKRFFTFSDDQDKRLRFSSQQFGSFGCCVVSCEEWWRRCGQL